jgi:PD-(D/E)XK nuclease superfamily
MKIDFGATTPLHASPPAVSKALPVSKRRSVFVEGLEPWAPWRLKGEPAEIHISDVRTFKGCRQKWNYASPLQRGLRAKRPAAPLWVGSAVHAALDRWYNLPTKSRAVITPADQLADWVLSEVMRLKKLLSPEDWAGIKPQMTENVSLAEGMLQTYHPWALRNDDFEVVACEQKFRLPLTEEADLCGKFDSVVKCKDGLWVHEFKTTASWWPEDYLFLDEQLNAYLAAANAMFENVRGVIFTFMLKKLPTRPKVLKSGKISFARINTTYEVALQAIREAGQSPNGYKLELAELRDQNNLFVRRTPVLRDGSELEAWWETLGRLASEMADPNVLIYHSPDLMHCRYCDYSEPCMLQQMGSVNESEQLLRVNYGRAERMEDVVADVWG